jgi:hypothetical protein
MPPVGQYLRFIFRLVSDSQRDGQWLAITYEIASTDLHWGYLGQPDNMDTIVTVLPVRELGRVASYLTESMSIRADPWNVMAGTLLTFRGESHEVDYLIPVKIDGISPAFSAKGLQLDMPTVWLGQSELALLGRLGIQYGVFMRDSRPVVAAELFDQIRAEVTLLADQADKTRERHEDDVPVPAPYLDFYRWWLDWCGSLQRQDVIGDDHRALLVRVLCGSTMQLLGLIQSR